MKNKQKYGLQNNGAARSRTRTHYMAVDDIQWMWLLSVRVCVCVCVCECAQVLVVSLVNFMKVLGIR